MLYWMLDNWNNIFLISFCGLILSAVLVESSIYALIYFLVSIFYISWFLIVYENLYFLSLSVLTLYVGAIGILITFVILTLENVVYTTKWDREEYFFYFVIIVLLIFINYIDGNDLFYNNLAESIDLSDKNYSIINLDNCLETSSFYYSSEIFLISSNIYFSNILEYIGILLFVTVLACTSILNNKFK